MVKGCFCRRWFPGTPDLSELGRTGSHSSGEKLLWHRGASDDWKSGWAQWRAQKTGVSTDSDCYPLSPSHHLYGGDTRLICSGEFPTLWVFLTASTVSFHLSAVPCTPCVLILQWVAGYRLNNLTDWKFSLEDTIGDNDRTFHQQICNAQFSLFGSC